MDGLTEAVRFLLEQQKRHNSDPSIVARVNGLLEAIESPYIGEAPAPAPQEPAAAKPNRKTKAAEPESPKA